MVVIESLRNNELSSGQGLNQKTILKRACDTHWGSHYSSLLRLISMILSIFEIIREEGLNSKQRCETTNLLELMQSFSFVFGLHLMRAIYWGLQVKYHSYYKNKDQDIVNVISLVRACKQQL